MVLLPHPRSTLYRPDPEPWQPHPDEQAPNLHPMPDPGTYDHADLVHCTEHPGALHVTGAPVRCPACDARRDWLIVRQGPHVWIRCRCAFQWAEPDLAEHDFDDLTLGPPDRFWSTYEEAVTSLGFDGVFKGLYL